MHRVDAPGSINGLFSDGNPAVGQQATALLAAWFNDIQENVCYIIEQAGIALEKGEVTQLSDAIVALVAGAVGDGSGNVPTTRQISVAGGLLSGGGSLAADRTITLNKASGADVVAGTSDDAAITPAALAAAASAGLGSNGYWKAPGGLMVQWGVVRGTYSEGPIYTAFPLEFPNDCYVVLPVVLNQTANYANDVWAQNVSRSNAGFTALFNYDGTNTNLIYGLDYIALGR